MHICEKCNKKFTLKKNLNRHLLNIHDIQVLPTVKSKGKHKCPVCENFFVERSSLRRHERSKHKINITASLQKKTTKQCVTFEPSNLEDYPLLKKLVPDGYVYKINKLESLGNNHLKTKFEIPDCSEKIFMNWLSELSQKSEVTYRVKSFTKSPSPKIVFNKVYRCEHNTFPHRYCDPHPKHTGCPSTLTVRIRKCSEALSLKNAMADNNVMIISLKAFVTLYHCHNHTLLKTIQSCSTKKENQEETENIVNIVNSSEPTSLNASFSLEESIENIKYSENITEMVEETIVLYETENNKLVTNDDTIEVSIENTNFELSEEFDNYIFVDNVSTENSLHNGDNENQLNHLLSEFDQVNEKILQQFESNPKYFLSAIKAYTFAMKNSLSSKKSLLNALHSFGNILHEGF